MSGHFLNTDRRERTSGVYLKASHFWIGLFAILTAIGLTPWAVVEYVANTAIEKHVNAAIERHDNNVNAHATILKAILETQRVGDQIVTDKLSDIDRRLSRIEGALGFRCR